MAIPVARVHLAMAHAALPGLLPTPSRCMMLLPPLLPLPPCAIILPKNSPPKHSRADAVERWDANKVTHGGGGGGGPASPSSSEGQCSLDSKSCSSGRASTCESWVSNKIRSAGAATATSSSSSSCSSGSRSSGSRADSEERWDARKKQASPAASPASYSASRSKTKTRPIRSRAPSASAERWDAHKKQPQAAPPADELDDGESSTGSNDVELDTPRKQQPPAPAPPLSFYAGPGFIKSPEPCMLPKPSFMVRVK